MNNNSDTLSDSLSPYLDFSREQWAELRNDEPMTLSQQEVEMLWGINDELSMDVVKDIYLPLSRLLSYYVESNKNRQAVLMKFLRAEPQKIPFVIGVAGSVSVGKSTVARVLQALLSRQKEHTKVSLIATDGFLYPNAVLQENGLMSKKGFPESYDIKALIEFVTDIKSGKRNVKCPVYSHLIYDIVPNEYEVIDQPDILILEGLNVLQSGMDYPSEKPRVFVSDFLDFSIYVDADEELLETWYIERFMKFRSGAFADPNSYFHNYTKLTDEEAIDTAKQIWNSINGKNLTKNILPTRERASLILHKWQEHTVDFVRLRK